MLYRVIRLYRDAFSGLNRDVWLACAVLLVNRAGTMVLPFLGLYLTVERQFSITVVGWLVAIYGMGGIAGSWLGGWLTDRVGAVRAQKLSLIASGVIVMGLLWVRHSAAIAATLFVLGLASDAFRPAMMTGVGERSPSHLQPKAFALVRLAANLGLAVGPALGGWLAIYSYGVLFVFDALTCWVAAWVLHRFLTEEASQTQKPLGVTAMVSSSPWRDGPFLALVLWIVGLITVLFQVMSTHPLYLRQAYELRENGIGMVLGLNAGLIVVFEMVLIHWLGGFRPMRVAAVGSLLLCAGFGLLPLGDSLAYALLTTVVWTLGEMLALPMVNAVVASRAPQASRGRYMGLFTMSFSVAFVLAPTLGTSVVAHYGADTLWYGVAATGLLLGAAALRLEPVLGGSAKEG